MFGIAAFLFTQASFSFLESNAILTDLSFFMVMTAGNIKQTAVVCRPFRDVLFQLLVLILLVRFFENR